MAYLHPGVYVEEIPSGSKPIEGVGTSTAAFVGFATKGPIGEPELIFKWDDYEQQYGGIRNLQKDSKGDPMGLSVAAFFQNGGGKAYIVRITEDWKRKNNAVTHAEKAVAYLDDPEDTGTRALKFSAVNEGAWANGLIVQMATNAVDSNLHDVDIGRNNDKGEFVSGESFTGVSLDSNDPMYIKDKIDGYSDLVTVDLITDITSTDMVSDRYLGTSISGDLSTVPIDFLNQNLNVNSRKIELAIDGNSTKTITVNKEDFADLAALALDIQTLVRALAAAEEDHYSEFTCVATSDGKLVMTSGSRKSNSAVVVTTATGLGTTLLLAASESTGQQSADAAAPMDTLDGGTDGGQPAEGDYVDVFTNFIKIRDINIMLLPGQHWSTDNSGNAIIQKAIGHAEKMKNRMVIVDPPPNHELETEKAVVDMELPSQTYCVVYYPWVLAANRFYHAERNPGLPRSVLVPPSGYAAGMWAKTDGRRGVWKAPAGMATGLLGVSKLEFVVEDDEQDALNPLGVNCYRSMPGAGKVVWGSRTRATRADPEWRYVPVRRTAIMIEDSIRNGIQWAVFEPNDHRLWSALRGNIDNFMNGLFRVGAFQGEKASDAYFVRCGLGDTMTQGEIDAGQVIVIVGFAPLKPAEFVIVRIQQKVNLQ
jgi:phage tail sheath protein FI